MLLAHNRARLCAAACAAALALLGVLAPARSAALNPAEKCAKGQKGCPPEKKRNLKKLLRANRAQTKPNIVVIYTDDQNVSDMSVMPTTLAQLGAQGATFGNSYVSYPLCCPSRATFLTGQYSHNNGVIASVLPNGFGGLVGSNTLPVWLRAAAYRTGFVGKYLNGYGVSDRKFIPPGWGSWFALTGNTDQKRYNYLLNENRKVRKYKTGPRNYVTDVLGAKVNRLLERWTPNPRPFFLWFAPTAPHGQNGTPKSSTRDPQPAPRHLGRFGNITAPRPPSFNEPDVSNKPAQMRALPQLTPDLLSEIDRRYRGRLESLLAVDEEVKRIVQIVRKYQDLGRTYFIFTSDNGLQLGTHRIMFKDYLYEEGERVPLLIRGPNIPAGVTRDQLVANIDLAPTIADIAGATPGLTMDGISLLPIMTGASQGPNRDLLFETFDNGIFGLRSGMWSFNQYGNGDQELYNLASDPFQVNNLANSPTTAALRAQLLAKLTQLKGCSGASCR